MKIILNQDVTGLGEEGDVREVAAGYARNFLIPRKLAAAYSRESLLQLEHRRAGIEKRKDEKRREAMSLKERLESEQLQFAMPAGENGKLFGSVNNAMVVQELEKRGYAVEKKRVEVPDHHIRMTGAYTVKVKLYGTEEAQVKVTVEGTAAQEQK